MDLWKERLKYILAVVLYGTIGMFLRFVNLPSEEVAFCRGLIGALFILLFRCVQKEKIDFQAIRNNLPVLLLTGISLGLNWIFLFAAYVTTTVAIASLCNYMAPIIVIILAPLILKEKLEVRKIPCVVAAFFGIVLVSGVVRGSIGSPVGIIYGLTAALCFACIVFCNRRLREIHVMDRAVAQLAISAVTILPYMLLRNGRILLLPDLRSGMIVLMLGVLHTGIAYCLYFSGMAILPVQSVAILGYLEPVVSVLCSVIFLREPFGWTGWIGAVLIIGSAIVSERIPLQKKR